MRRFAALVVAGLAALAATGILDAAAQLPAWAYAIPAPPAAGGPPAPAAAPDTSMKQIPGSALSFTRQQIGDGFGPADWFPGDHPAMPDIVAHGRRPDARACGLCHYPNGKGRQENAGISGLPVSYFVQQMNDFRRGVRKSAEPRKTNTNLMITIAKALTPEEIQAVAEYFAAMKWTPWIRVVETATVPKMESHGGIWVPSPGGQMEPIGVRIMETPVDAERTEVLRDPRSGFIAYAPMGSIKKGEVLVQTGGNRRTEACGACHGADLQGLGPVPGIAGRSPSYLVRQMYDMQAGARHGEWADLMMPVVASLTDEDLVNIAAYVSSLMPLRDMPTGQQAGSSSPASVTSPMSTISAGLDFEFFKSKVQPIFLAKRPGHARCISCHSNGTPRLQPLARGATSWSDEESRKNFEAWQRAVVPGSLKSPLLVHPLAEDAGGDFFHSGGKHWSSQNDPEWQTLKAWVFGQTASGAR